MYKEHLMFSSTGGGSFCPSLGHAVFPEEQGKAWLSRVLGISLCPAWREALSAACSMANPDTESRASWILAQTISRGIFRRKLNHRSRISMNTFLQERMLDLRRVVIFLPVYVEWDKGLQICRRVFPTLPRRR